MPFDPARQLLMLDRAEYEESLYLFLRAAWTQIASGPFVDGWAIEAVAEHLQAVIDGYITRLIINLPPRMAKSSMCAVALPAWTWAQPEITPTSGPQVPFLHASYAERLSIRDSAKCRRLIKSKWYQGLWGDRFSLNKDEDTKHRFSNDKGGERLITSIGGTATGEGAMIGVIDDPNAANEAFSDATIEATNEWWDGTMPTRLNDPDKGAFIIIQQRLSEMDLTGHILEKEDASGWTHLVLPMRFEPDRAFVTPIDWIDPRAEEGELLFPERFSEKAVKALETSLGPFRAAGQLQQRPEPKGGGIIKRDWWRLWDRPEYPPMDYIIASLDTAYTEKEENDPSALTIWGVFTDDANAQANRMIGPDGRPSYLERTFIEGVPKVMLMYAWTGRFEIHELRARAAADCRRFKVDRLLIEAKATGISLAQEMRRLNGHEDWGVQLVNPGAQDKTARLYSVQHLFAEGMVWAPDKAWADLVITQCGTFPKGRHDDLVDTTSQAMRHLRDIGVLIRSDERMAELADMARQRPTLQPLYEC